MISDRVPFTRLPRLAEQTRATEDAATLHDQERAPKLSVLVPVYNAEPYLRECLDSLAGQTLTDIQFVCVNDGSTDASPAILDDYAARDNRFQVIHKPNTGYGDSMNRALEEARGEWVGICEPDDFCDATMYEKLVGAAEAHGCDLAKANYSAYERAAGELAPYETFAGFPYGRARTLRRDPSILYTDPTIWAGVYRRSMIRDNAISFTPSPGASFQDASFAHQCWLSARRYVLLPEGLYRYRVDNAASSSKSGAKVFAVCDEYDHTMRFLRDRGDGDLKRYGPWVNTLRFAVYVWNYNRIAPEYHLQFAERWSADVVAADDEGLLDIRLLTPGYRSLLSDLLADPAAFCRAHEKGIEQPPLK